jgi:outer membrane receptor for Fe3+-dicitrate
MVYSSKFVVSILVDGKFLKERNDGICEIPFDSTYQIQLKNKHSKRAKASLYIDEIHQGDFVVNAYDDAIIERPANENASFVFVRPTSSRAIAQGKNKIPEGTKGVIKVLWSLETEKQLPVAPYEPYKYPIAPPRDIPWKRRYPYDAPWQPYEPIRYGVSNQTGGISSSWASSQMVGCSYNATEQYVVSAQNLQAKSVSRSIEDGVTVKGDRTNQEFTVVYTTWESDFVEMKIVLKGYDGPPKRDERYCGNCGAERNKKHRFCGFCSFKY